jgi:tungstate transport system substrate-binding protein
MTLLSCLSTPKNQRRLQDRSKPSFWLGLFSALFLLSPLGAETIVMSSTTSTEQSGLFAHLLPKFREVSGITVKVVALGTGQALDVARRGDADVVFVHDRAAEDRFVSEGFAERRYDVMYNDFVLIGPASDPAGIKGKDLISALKQIASSQVLFTSRGDRSGTHAAELRFWKTAAIEPAALVGYKACGCGMGQALNIAAASGSYLLADRGTWLSFKNRADLAILLEGDQRLFNPYGVMAVSRKKHPHVKAEAAEKLVQWLVSSQGQAAIASYRIAGEALFFPSAKGSNESRRP